MGRASDIAARLADRAEEVCRAYLPNGRRSGAYWIVGDAAGAKGQSCYVRLRGGRDRIGKWRDQNPANGDHYGDLLDLIRVNRGLGSLAEAVAEAEAFLGGPAPFRPPLAASAGDGADDTLKRRNAERLWARSRELAGTKAERYLLARGLNPSGLVSLRYHPDAYYYDDDAEQKRSGPALIAAVRDGAGEMKAVHRTWFDGDSVILRKMMGLPDDGVVALGGTGPGLLVGEGIETVSSLRGVFASVRLEALLTAGRLMAFDPPDDIDRLLIAVDRDPAGFVAARCVRAKARALGVPAFCLVPASAFYGADFNDDLTRFGFEVTASAVRRQAGE